MDNVPIIYDFTTQIIQGIMILLAFLLWLSLTALQMSKFSIKFLDRFLPAQFDHNKDGNPISLLSFFEDLTMSSPTKSATHTHIEKDMTIIDLISRAEAISAIDNTDQWDDDGDAIYLSGALNAIDDCESRTRTFTKADVEAVARAHCDYVCGDGWFNNPEAFDTQDHMIAAAHAALSAIGKVEG